MAKPIVGLTEAARAAGMPGGNYVPKGMITWRMGQVHVSTSALDVAREFWHKRAAAFPRPIKRAVVRCALKCHAQNRSLYRAVMSGRF
jgi:hypothetical protein